MQKKLTFSTYPSLIASFKQVCDLLSTTMSCKLEHLTEEYLKDSLCSFEELTNSLSETKRFSSKEIRDYKTTISLDLNTYEQLKEKLAKSRIRPASFFTLLMAYTVTSTPTEELYKKKAILELAESDSSITDVAYGIKYCKPNATHEIFHTEFFIDPCTETRFYELYKKPDIECPYIQVLALHKNFS